MTENNVYYIYILRENAGTTDEYDRYYIKLRDSHPAHEVTLKLWETIRDILRDYAVPNQFKGAYEVQDLIYFDRTPHQYNAWGYRILADDEPLSEKDIQNTYDDFLAGTGRM